MESGGWFWAMAMMGRLIRPRPHPARRPRDGLLWAGATGTTLLGFIHTRGGTPLEAGRGGCEGVGVREMEG